MGLLLLACWDCGFKSCQGHGRLPLVNVAGCQVEVSAMGQRSLRDQLKCNGVWWCTRGEVKGKRANGVGSPLHTVSEHDVSSITTTDEHTSAASSQLNWCPCWFKRTRPFYWKTKSGFCACAISFQMQSTVCVVFYCDLKASTMNSPRPTRAVEPLKKWWQNGVFDISFKVTWCASLCCNL